MGVMKKLVAVLFGLVCLLGAHTAKAQGIAIRTNFAEWAAQAPNMGVDLVFNESTSLSISMVGTAGASYIKDAKIIRGEIEYRYWLSHQPYENFFFGLQFMPTYYNLKLKHGKNKVEPRQVVHNGVAAPVGFNFGYCWPLNSRFNLEACYGAGWYFYNNSCSLSGTSHNIAFSTTNVGLSVTYILK